MEIQIQAALVGAISALTVMLIKDGILDFLKNRQNRQRELLKERIEKAYAPLDYLLYRLFTTEDNIDEYRSLILSLIKQYSHLLSEDTLGIIYALVNLDGIKGALGFYREFGNEYERLCKAFYRASDSIQKLHR